MSTVWIRVTYAAVVAVLILFSTMFGIQMVSAGPTPPAIPDLSARQLFDSSNTDSTRGQNTLRQNTEKFYDEARAWRENSPGYARNVFLAATGVGILFVLIGLALPQVTNYLRLGFVLGGLLLFIYAFMTITRPAPDVPIQGDLPLSLLVAGFPKPLNFAARFAMFAVSFIGFILALFLGLWRLTEWSGGARPRVVMAPAAAPVARNSVPVAAAAAPVPAAAGGSQWAPPPPPAAAPPVTVEPVRGEAVAVETAREPEADVRTESTTTEWKRPDDGPA